MTLLHRRAARDGFTLIEILVALAIFVGAAAALSRLVLLGIENAEYSRLQTVGLMLAESKFAELDAGILTVDDNTTNPEESMPGWEWTLQSQSAGPIGLYLVTVEVRNSDEAARGYSLTLTRLYFDEAEVVDATAETTTDAEATQ